MVAYTRAHKKARCLGSETVPGWTADAQVVDDSSGKEFKLFKPTAPTPCPSTLDRSFSYSFQTDDKDIRYEDFTTVGRPKLAPLAEHGTPGEHGGLSTPKDGSTKVTSLSLINAV